MPGNSGQRSDGWRFEQLPGCDPDSLLLRASYYLQADNRVPTQFKKAIMNADPLQTQYLFPDLSQQSFSVITRVLLITGGSEHPFLECLAVQLSARCQRDGAQSHEC